MPRRRLASPSVQEQLRRGTKDDQYLCALDHRTKRRTTKSLRCLCDRRPGCGDYTGTMSKRLPSLPLAQRWQPAGLPVTPLGGFETPRRNLLTLTANKVRSAIGAAGRSCRKELPKDGKTLHILNSARKVWQRATRLKVTAGELSGKDRACRSSGQGRQRIGRPFCASRCRDGSSR